MRSVRTWRALLRDLAWDAQLRLWAIGVWRWQRLMAGSGQDGRLACRSVVRARTPAGRPHHPDQSRSIRAGTLPWARIAVYVLVALVLFLLGITCGTRASAAVRLSAHGPGGLAAAAPSGRTDLSVSSAFARSPASTVGTSPVLRARDVRALAAPGVQALGAAAPGEPVLPEQEDPGETDDLPTVINNATEWLRQMALILATCALTLGGLLYLFAREPAHADRAKQFVVAALTGYALALLAPQILAVVRTILGAGGS